MQLQNGSSPLVVSSPTTVFDLVTLTWSEQPCMAGTKPISGQNFYLIDFLKVPKRGPLHEAGF